MRVATPRWVDRRVLEAIHNACPEGHVVAFIEPLLTPDSCGLNVPWNLKIVPREAARMKLQPIDAEYRPRVIDDDDVQSMERAA